METSHTNLIGKEIVRVNDDDPTTMEWRGEIVGINIGDGTFMIAVKTGAKKGQMYTFSDWSLLRLAKYWFLEDSDENDA